MARHAVLPSQCGVYVSTNTVNGKQYVGSSVDMRNRLYTHVCQLRHGTSRCGRLMAAWRKYGEAAFVWSVLELVPDREDLQAAEQRWVDKLKPAYNIRIVANSNAGITRASEVVERQRQKMLGQKRSAETRERHRQNRLGMKFSPEWCANIKKRVFTPEARAKMSAAKKGKIPWKATNASADKSRGVPRSPEVRAKIAAGQARRWAQQAVESGL